LGSRVDANRAGTKTVNERLMSLGWFFKPKGCGV
jgi:hypothetical protein